MPPIAREDLINQLGCELREFIARVILRNQAVADHLGLHLVDLQCLNLIALADSPLTPGQISERARLATSSATRVLDRLEAAGYIDRARDTRDRRKVFIHPIPTRLQELTDYYARQETGIAGVTSALSERDLQGMLSFLRAANQSTTNDSSSSD